MVRRRSIQLAFIALTALAVGRPAFAAGPPEADAEELARRGYLDQALTTAQRRQATHPADVANHEFLIDLLLTVGRSAQAESAFAERLRKAPDNPDNHYLLGRALVDVRHAREAYENALRLDPEHARSHMGIAAVHSAQGRHGDAEAAYRRAVVFDPSLSEAWLGLVRTYGQAGQADRAAKAASDGLAAVPNDPGLALAVATLEPERAGPVLSSAVVVTPSDVPLRVAWASFLLHTGDATAAATEARTALSIEPGHTEGRRLAMVAAEVADGRLTRDQADTLEAQRTDPTALDGLLAAAPRSSLARLARAQLHHQEGRPEAARTLLQEAVDLDPSNDEALASCGHAWLVAGDPNRAAPLLEKAVAARPWDAESTIHLAAALGSQGMTSRSLGLLGELAEARPMHVVAQAAYAQALLDAGRAEEAYQLLKAAMERLPDPRIAAAFIMVAPEAGHHEEAAAIMELIAEKTGNPALKQKAAALRAAGQ